MVGVGDETSDNFGTIGASSYDFSVHSPNGFLRTFAGSLAANSANLTVNAIYEDESRRESFW